MARQAGPIFITGTIDDVVFYKLGDNYYMRLKGEPTPSTKKRMSDDKHYPVLCMRKREFKQASQMVREWYYTLPKEVRKHGLFGKLTGKAVRMLRKGVKEEKIKTLLRQEVLRGKEAMPPTGPTQDAETRIATTPTQPAEKPVVALGNSAWQVDVKGQLHTGQVQNASTQLLLNSHSAQSMQKGYCWPAALPVSGIQASYASG